MSEIIERIQESLARKHERIPITVTFSGLQDNLPASQQAEWMVQLLQHTYHQHAITNRQGEVERSIEDGSTQCFFAHENGIAQAVAALITQADGSRELGRAAALTQHRGVGGVVMLSAALEHLSKSDAPLIAEVRVSQEFEGVAGGIATQTICLRDIGLQPHALLPLFGHGDPRRQEQFLLSSSKLELTGKPISAPMSNRVADVLREHISPLGDQRGFEVVLEASQRDLRFNGWVMVQQQPFAILRPSVGTAKLETATSEAFAQATCCVAPIEARPDLHLQMTELLNHGFVPCGIDRVTGTEGEPIVQFARLKPGTVLAPLGLVESLFTKPQMRALTVIDEAIRKGAER
jgi:hypothetical protein